MSVSVLYLEDDSSSFLLASTMLDMLDINDVEHVSSLQELKDFMRSSTKRIDLVLMDIMLPDGDSSTILPSVKDRYDCPVVAFTASSFNDEIERFNALGFDDVFVKPMNFDDFERQINILLKRH